MIVSKSICTINTGAPDATNWSQFLQYLHGKKKDLQNPLKSKERIEEMGWKVYKLSFGEPVYFHQAKKVYFK